MFVLFDTWCHLYAHWGSRCVCGMGRCVKGLTWLIKLSRGLPSEPTRQVRSCGIHANHWMGGTPMQYLSTASARVFLSSKLRSHNTCRGNESRKT